MSLTISAARQVEIATHGLEGFPIATWNDWASAAGTTVSSNRSTVTDGALANATNGGTYDFWLPDLSAATSVTFQITRAADFTCNFVGIAAHNLGSIGGVTVAVQHSADGSTWTGLNASVVPTDDRNIGFYFADTTARYFRLIMSGFTAGDDPFFGVVMFGQALTFAEKVWAGFTPPLRATEVEMIGNVSEGAQYIGAAIVKRGQAASIPLGRLAPSFVRGAEFQAFQERFNTGRPFFIAWRPQGYDDLLYAWRSGAVMAPSNDGPTYHMTGELQVRAFDDAA